MILFYTNIHNVLFIMESYNNFIRNLKAKIECKRIENKQYGKIYAINEIDKTVIKCKLCDSKLEIEIVKDMQLNPMQDEIYINSQVDRLGGYKNEIK